MSLAIPEMDRYRRFTPRVLGLMDEGVSNRPGLGGGPSTPMYCGDGAAYAESLGHVVAHLGSAPSKVGA